MGYTHYYFVSEEFDAESFAKVAKDFKTMMTPLKHLGVILADGLGVNHATVSPTQIQFNGLEKCGHEQRDLGITWPCNDAKGVSTNKVGQQLEEITKGKWFAGAELRSRACGGDCAHETFTLEQKFSDAIPAWQQENLEAGKPIFQCTKTAYKPYDLAVNVCLVIAKHHLGDSIKVRSDGPITNWEEAMHLCEHFLGYGVDFTLDPNEEDEA